MAKRNEICTKRFINKDGTETASAQPDTTSLRFQFHDDDKSVRTVKLSDFAQDIRDCFGWYGAANKCGDSYAMPAGTGIAIRIKSFDDTLQQLIDGEWIVKGERAAPTSLLWTALVSVLKKTQGPKFTEKAEEELRSIVYAKETKKVDGKDVEVLSDTAKAARKKYRAIPAIQAELVRMEQEALAAKAKELGKATDVADILGDLKTA